MNDGSWFSLGSLFRQTHVTHEGKGLDGDFKPGKREFDHRMEVQYICAFFLQRAHVMPKSQLGQINT